MLGQVLGRVLGQVLALMLEIALLLVLLLAQLLALMLVLMLLLMTLMEMVLVLLQSDAGQETLCFAFLSAALCAAGQQASLLMVMTTVQRACPELAA